MEATVIPLGGNRAGGHTDLWAEHPQACLRGISGKDYYRPPLQFNPMAETIRTNPFHVV